MTKNTDPEKLDQTNVGDAAVLTREDGSSQSCIITEVSCNFVRLEWATSRTTKTVLKVHHHKYKNHLTLFPAGCKFLAV